MRLPNLNALKMFDAAARHLNFRLAAEELNLTQGAVAQQVRRLEADLGLALFERKPRGLELTETGRAYHEAIRSAIAIIEDATRKLIPSASQIKLSVTPSFASKWLVKRLSRFALACPDIDLQIVAEERLVSFRADGVDLAIRHAKPKHDQGLKSFLFAPLNLCAVTGPNYAKEIGPITRIEDLTAHSLVHDGHRYSDKLLEGANKAAQKRIMRLNQTALATEVAMNGQGIALAPHILVQDDVAAGRLVVIRRDSGAEIGGYYLVHPEAAKPNPALDRVIAWLKSEVA